MWALLPLKNFDFAKSRLSALLTGVERRGLFLAMVRDVLGVLSKHPDLGGILVVSDDQQARSLSTEFNVDFLEEASLNVAGLSAVVEASVKFLSAQGVDDVMVVHGDLSMLNNAGLNQLLSVHERNHRRALTIVPDRHLTGSNCLLCRRAGEFTFHYGEDSLRKHVDQGKAIGMDVVVEIIPSIGCDIDTPEDIAYLLKHARDGEAQHTRQFLADKGIEARVWKHLNYSMAMDEAI